MALSLGLLEVLPSWPAAHLTLQPKLIDAKGSHGFTLHFHSQVGGKDSENVLDYLQFVKQLELKPS